MHQWASESMGQWVSKSTSRWVSESASQSRSVGLSVSNQSTISQSVGQAVSHSGTLPLSVCLSVCPIRLSIKFNVSQLPVSSKWDRHEILCIMSILTIVVFPFTNSSHFYSFQHYSSFAICCSELVNCDEENSFITRTYWRYNLRKSALRKLLQRHRYSCKYAKRVLWVKLLMRTDIALLHNSYAKRNYSYSNGGVESGESGRDSTKSPLFLDQCAIWKTQF